ncbi:MAG: hypothetical protein ACO1TE_30095 [Prosthecobacter sp.]
MTHHALITFVLAPAALLLSSCGLFRSVQVEYLSPEFKKTGLRGRTIALGEVLSARPQYDPTPGETAAALVACETWLKEERPSTRVVSYVAFGQQVGALKTRFHGGAGLALAAVTPAQYKKALAAGVDYVVLAEMLEKESRSGTRIIQEESTTTEKDENGKEVEKTTTTDYHESYATCWVDCRYHVVDARTRQIVWQAKGGSVESETKRGDPVNSMLGTMPAIPTMPSHSSVMRDLAENMMSKLPK